MQSIYFVPSLCYNISMQFNQFPTKTITGIALSSALLTGCAQNPELTFSPDAVRTVEADGIIVDGVNVRKSPQRIENEGFHNSCGKLSAAVNLESVEAAISEGIGIDSNGDWIGIKPQDLPSDIAEGCTSEYGNMLWVATKEIIAFTVEPLQPIRVANER